MVKVIPSPSFQLRLVLDLNFNELGIKIQGGKDLASYLTPTPRNTGCWLAKSNRMYFTVLQMIAQLAGSHQQCHSGTKSRPASISPNHLLAPGLTEQAQALLSRCRLDRLG